MSKWVNTSLCLLTVAAIIAPLSALHHGVTPGGTVGVPGHTAAVAVRCNGGWLEERDGVRILHLSGTSYEMGYQHGVLLKEEIQENMRMMLAWFEHEGYPYDVILEVWDVMKEFLPQEYKDEMQGMADGIDLSFEEVAVYNTWPAVVNHVFMSCCGAALWGSATLDGTLYHVRSLDILHPAHDIKDPETGTYIRENQVLIVRDPDSGYASVVPEFAGAVSSWGGVNEKGIAISAKTCLTYDSTFQGISAAFRMRMVLDHAATAEEATTIMNAHRTCGWNFIISDGHIPRGYIIEQTANLVYVGAWFDPVESTGPFWEIEDVVRRTVMFISPACAATQPQRAQYDPSGLRGFLSFLMGHNRCFTAWNQYRALSEGLEDQWGTLDLNTSMAMLRDVYLGRTDFLFSVLQKLRSFAFMALHQWVACPETGEIVVAFADANDESACETPVHYFNLYELLEAEPP